MTTGIAPHYRRDTADYAAILAHLQRCSDRFVPALHQRVDLFDYAKRIADNSKTFEAWDGTELRGLVAVYLNDLERRCGFITDVSVDLCVTGQGIAAALLRQCIDAARLQGFHSISLDVFAGNVVAIAVYERLGFVCIEKRKEQLMMRLDLV